MKYNLKLFVLVMIFLPAAIANSNCFNYACSDLNLPGGSGFTISGSNIPGQNNAPTYQKCNIIATDTSPLVFDYDNNGFPDVITISESTLRAYSPNCVILHSQSITTGPEGSATVSNIDADAYQELAFTNGTNALFYEWNGSTFLLLENIDIQAFTGLTNVQGMACSRASGLDSCIATSRAADDVFLINWSNSSSTVKLAELPRNSGVDFDASGSYQGLGIGREATTQYYRYATPSFNGNDFFFDTMDSNGNFLQSSGDISSASGAISNPIYYQSAWGKIGTNFYLFLHATYSKTSLEMAHIVYDVDMNAKVSPCGNSYCISSTNYTSNWAVADFNKDGVNEACMLISNEPSNAMTLRCYDESFTTPIINQPCAVQHPDAGLYMADFFPTNSTLGIATGTGIYSTENGACTKKGNSTYTYASISWNQTQAIGFSYGSFSMPVYVFDDGNTAFIIRDTSSVDTCGNDVCEDYENAFSCAADCLNITTAPGVCSTDIDCPTAYPYCLLGLCIASEVGTNFTCTFDTDCPYNAPFCYEGYCVTAAQVGIPNATGSSTATKNANLDNSIDFFVDTIFGTSPYFKFLIAVLTTIGIVFAASRHSDNAMVVIFIGVFSIVLFTVLGFIPSYVLILMIVVGLIIAFLGRHIMGQSAGNG